MDIVPFDLHRMFLGDLPPLFLLEIAVRTFIMYAYMLLAVRFLGKRSFGQLTVFGFIIVILLGSAAGDPMFYQDVPLLYGFVVITVVVLFERALNYLTKRSRKLEIAVEDKARLFIKDGAIIYEALDIEEVSRDEVMMELRLRGIRNTGAVERGYLEPSGRLSVFTYPEGKEVEGESTVPPDEDAKPRQGSRLEVLK